MDTEIVLTKRKAAASSTYKKLLVQCLNIALCSVSCSVQADKGLIITTGKFSREAKKEA